MLSSMDMVIDDMVVSICIYQVVVDNCECEIAIEYRNFTYATKKHQMSIGQRTSLVGVSPLTTHSEECRCHDI